MSAGIWFWILLIVGVVFGVFATRTPDARWSGYWPFWMLVLIALLGWAQFGSPIR